MLAQFHCFAHHQLRTRELVNSNLKRQIIVVKPDEINVLRHGCDRLSYFPNAKKKKKRK